MPGRILGEAWEYLLVSHDGPSQPKNLPLCLPRPTYLSSWPSPVFLQLDPVCAGIGPGLSETLQCEVLVGLALVGLHSSFGVLALKVFSGVMEINPSDSCGPMESAHWLCPVPEFTERCLRLTCCWGRGRGGGTLTGIAQP